MVFALVFAVAAIIAVTMGPAILIWQNPRGSWRTKVVRVGLLHLCLCLLAFMGAFACSGFVTALVRPPPANCALIKCTDGGVPCSTDQQIPFMFHDPAVDATAAKIGTRAWYLDAQLLQLNAAKFYLPNETAATDRAPVICANYPTMSLCSHSDSSNQYPYGSSYNLFSPCGGNATLPEGLCICAAPQIQESVTIEDYGYTTWCSVVDIQGKPQNSLIGSRLLVTAPQVYNLMKVLAFQQTNCSSTQGLGGVLDAIHEMQRVLKDVKFGPWASGPCFSNQAWAHMPALASLFGLLRIPHSVPLLPPQKTTPSGLYYTWSSLYQDPQTRFYIEVLGGNTGNGVLVAFPIIPLCWEAGNKAGLDCTDAYPFSQANAMQSDAKNTSNPYCLAHSIQKDSSQWEYGQPGCPFYEQDDKPDYGWGGYGLLELDPAYSRGGPASSTWASCLEESGGPLSNATSYATLRYVCSNGVLCDKGDVMHPLKEPLAVDPQGQFLTRNDVIKYSGQDITVSATTRQLQWSVIAMLIVAVCANLLSVLWLTGYLEALLVAIWTTFCRFSGMCGSGWNKYCADKCKEICYTRAGRIQPPDSHRARSV